MALTRPPFGANDSAARGNSGGTPPYKTPETGVGIPGYQSTPSEGLLTNLPPVDPANPQNLNRYAYTRNNPTTNTDPSGHVTVFHEEGCNGSGSNTCTYSYGWHTNHGYYTQRQLKGTSSLIGEHFYGMIPRTQATLLEYVLLAAVLATVVVSGPEIVTAAASYGDVVLDIADCASGDPLGCAGIATEALGPSDNLLSARHGLDIGEVSEVIYRAGGRSPSNLTLRDGQEALSFRSSLSNPIRSADQPVFKPGREYIGVDPSGLPQGSLVIDNAPHGHVSVYLDDSALLQSLIVEKGRFPK